MGASSELAPYVPHLPADPAQWSYDQFIAALREVDNRSTWAKVRIVGALADRYGGEDDGGAGKLRDAAKDAGLAHATVLNYRAVDEAYPVAEFGWPNCSVGVALAFIALDDRLELVSRAEPWTREEARKLAAERAKNDPFPRDEEPARPKRGRPRQDKANTLPHQPVSAINDSNSLPDQPGTETVTVAAEPVAPAMTTARRVAQSDSAPCPGCMSLTAELEKAHAEITRLARIRPDTMMAEELKEVREHRDRLAQENEELSKRLQNGQVATGQAVPAVVPQAAEQAADGAHGEPQAASGPSPKQLCGRIPAGKVHIILPDDRETEKWFCGKHAEMVAGSGAEVSAVPPADEWDIGSCQYPVRAEVSA